MSLPLACLRRHSGQVWLFDRFAKGLPTADPPVTMPAPSLLARFDIRFAKSVQGLTGGRAEAYFQFWRDDADALRQLRHVLHGIGHTSSVTSCSGDELIRAVAAQVSRGVLVLVESSISMPPISGLPKPVTATSPEATAPLTQKTEPEAVEKKPLKEAAEEVQIEGAEVLPEIEQSLEQINLSLENIDLGSVSLEPAPTKIPAIAPAMTKASTSITDTLDDL